MERAIAAFTSALEVRTRSEFPVQWVEIQNNLGIAYCGRIRGDRAENIERAIAAFTDASEARIWIDFPAQWVEIQNNLGTAYCERIRGDRAKNVERAIAAFTSALEARTWIDFPAQWAQIQNNLGIALKDRYAVTGRLADLEQAIHTYEETVRHCSAFDSPHLPMFLENLGSVLRERFNRSGALADLERAIQAYKGAVAQTPPNSPDLPSRLDKIAQLLSHAGTIQAYAIARIKDHQLGQHFHLDKVYVLLAGVQSGIPEGFEGVIVSLPSQEETIKFEIVVHAEDISIEPSWRQSLVFHRGRNGRLLEFRLIPREIGTKEIRVEYYYQRHWLAQITFEVKVVEASELVLA
jgi:tetratricopeptide (TPR) repeat protein